MEMWQLLVIIGLIFLVLEMFTPVLFFLNFAIAAFFTSLGAVYIHNVSILMLIFVLLSLLLIWFLRPLLVKKNHNKELSTGMEAKYIDKIATVLDPVSQFKGTISIYDERWDARTFDDEIIEKGVKVRITQYDSLIMFVEKIGQTRKMD